MRNCTQKKSKILYILFRGENNNNKIGRGLEAIQTKERYILEAEERGDQAS